MKATILSTVLLLAMGAGSGPLAAAGPGAGATRAPGPALQAVDADGEGAEPSARDDGEGGGEVYSGMAGELSVSPPSVESPSMEIDARLEEGAWERAAVLTGFTQFEPHEGEPASQETEVHVFLSRDAIYFGVRAHDANPDGIRATLGERDEAAESDDYIRFSLDTFDDQRRAYVFLVNPLGVQQDGIWVEGGGGRRREHGPPIDWNPDFVWESAGRLDDGGYTLEVRIPLKSLRFRAVPVQRWGIQVVRAIKRNGYEASWAPISKDAANQLSQQGRLVGLRGLDPGLFLELNPVLTARRTGEMVELDSGEEAFRRADPTADFGFNATYGLTSNLTLDATYNPDFSQVEADAGQIAVNERFALFFPEKRPFFLEGTEIFSLPLNLVFTRTIVDPVAGAKLTGKLGGLNVGYLGAVDDGGSELGAEEGSKAVVNVVRARHDVGTSSVVGLTYTDRSVASSSYNRVAGVDGRFVLGERYALSFQGGGSLTRRGGDEDAYAGSFLRGELERSGRNLSFSASIEDLAPEFEARSGFIRRTGDARLRSRFEYDRYGSPGSFIERWGPRGEFRRVWDHRALWRGEGPKEGEAQLGGSVSFRNNMALFVTYMRRFFSYAAEEYEDLRVRAPGDGTRPFAPDPERFDGLDGLRFFLWTQSLDALRGRIRLEWREEPIFHPATGAPVEPADQYTVDGSFTLLPATSLRAEIGLRHEELYRKADGSRYSIATIPRLELQYQFSRALFLRAIGEYARQEREAPRDPVGGGLLEYCDEDDGCEPLEATESNDVHVEALLSYEPTPGTIMFIGYSRDMEDGRAFGFDELDPRRDGLFAKVSYRFRF